MEWMPLVGPTVRFMKKVLSQLTVTTPVEASTHFTLGAAREGFAEITRVNSIPARAIAIDYHVGLGECAKQRKFNLAHNERASLSIVLPDRFVVPMKIGISWKQGCKRLKTELSVFGPPQIF